VLAAESAREQLPPLDGIRLAILPDGLLQKFRGLKPARA
jgi:hypothetical protein